MALLSSEECKRLVLLVARPDMQVRAESRALSLDVIFTEFMNECVCVPAGQRGIFSTTLCINTDTKAD